MEQAVEDEQTTVDTQPEGDEEEADDSPQGDGGQDQASGDEGGNEQEMLASLLEREATENDPEFTDEELDVLDKYYDGKLKPPEKDGDTSSNKPKSKKDEADEDSEQDDGPEDTSKFSSNDLQIMKEVGAKTKGEVLEKIKGLRKVVSGKLEESPQYKELVSTNQALVGRVKNEIQLLNDLKAGKPEAISHFETNYGVKIAAPGSSSESDNGNTQQSRSNKGGDEEAVLDPDMFVDEEVYNQVNNAFGFLKGKLSELTQTVSHLQEKDKSRESEFAQNQASASLLDEMAEIAPHLGMGNIKNFRGVAKQWLDNMNDSRLDMYKDLFDIANEKNVDLRTAWEIEKGRKADLAINRAKTEGRKSAYDVKPNKSLSGVQGRRGEGQSQTFTDAQIDAMAENDQLMPDEWFDENDNLVLEKVPKEARRIFN